MKWGKRGEKEGEAAKKKLRNENTRATVEEKWHIMENMCVRKETQNYNNITAKEE